MSNFLRRLFRRPEPDYDFQAGSLGLSTRDTVTRYLQEPGNVLALLRAYRQQTLEQVSSGTGIPIPVLEAYESGRSAPSLPHIPRLAKQYQAELKFLLDVFGHTAANSPEESMGIAAHFEGTLSQEEKLDLRELVQAFSKNRAQ
ncbi:MAG: helix-turn-helix transcriptional regulator [Hyphomicrobium sp.]